jgi:hypothetical protein
VIDKSVGPHQVDDIYVINGRTGQRRDGRAFDRRKERGRQHFFGPPSGAHAAHLRSKGIID